jgi:hypothetical protein
LAHTQRVVTGLIELLLGPPNRTCTDWSRRPALRLAAELHYSRTMTAEAMMVAFGPWSPLQQLASHCGCRLVMVTRLREPLDFYLSFYRWVRRGCTRRPGASAEGCLWPRLGTRHSATGALLRGLGSRGPTAIRRLGSHACAICTHAHAHSPCTYRMLHAHGRRSRGAKPPTHRIGAVRCSSGRRATYSRVYCSLRTTPPSRSTWGRGHPTPPRAAPSEPASLLSTTRPDLTTLAGLTWDGRLVRPVWRSYGACCAASIWWGCLSDSTRRCYCWPTSLGCSGCLRPGAALCPRAPMTCSLPRRNRSVQTVVCVPRRLRRARQWTP